MTPQLTQSQVPPGYSARTLREAVRARYSAVATAPTAGFNFRVGQEFAEALGYDPAEVSAAPLLARESFTGVAAIIRHARIQPGETVLDLGCGAGLDLSIASRQVGSHGRVIGIDMAPSMVSRARSALRSITGVRGGVCLGFAESLPLLSGSIDCVVVNGILNLAPDKPAILAEIHRVLRPLGRLLLAETTIRAGEVAPPISSIDDWFR